VSIVGVSRTCLDDRDPATPPSQMLISSRRLISSRVAVDFHLTHQVRRGGAFFSWWTRKEGGEIKLRCGVE